jgi:hypothetical protein
MKSPPSLGGEVSKAAINANAENSLSIGYAEVALAFEDERPSAQGFEQCAAHSLRPNYD